MKLDFQAMEEKTVDGLRGGKGLVRMRGYTDGDNRVIMMTMTPGSAIGLHTHETDSETIYIVKGEGRMNQPQGSIPVSAGDTLHCPRGGTHALENPGTGELVALCIIPTHAKA